MSERVPHSLPGLSDKTSALGLTEIKDTIFPDSEFLRGKAVLPVQGCAKGVVTATGRQPAGGHGATLRLRRFWPT